MERGDDGGVVTGNHAGWTPAQGFVRYHHGRGVSLEHAESSRLCPFGAACPAASPLRFAGPVPPAIPLPTIPLPAIPLLLHPRLPQPSQPLAAIARTECPEPGAAVAAERGRWRPPPLTRAGR